MAKLAVYDSPAAEGYVGLEDVIFVGDHSNGRSFHGTEVNYVAQAVYKEFGQGVPVEQYAVSTRMGFVDFCAWAIANGIHVINISRSIPKGDKWDVALQKVLNAGIIVISAAGNDGADGVTWPASDPRVIAVGNWDTAKETIAKNSSVGPEVYVSAQGNWQIPLSTGHFNPAYGTSFAAPYVAMCAAIWVELTGGSREGFMEFVKAHSKDVMAPGRDNYSGWGLFNWPEGWIPKEDTSMKVSTKVITFDTAHGGADPGAIGNGIVEKDWSLNFVKLLKQKVEAKYDVRIILTRGNDSTVPNGTRDDIARANKSVGFLSFHVNSVADPAANGFESFVYTFKNGEPLVASFIHAAVIAYLEQYGIKDRGKKAANYQVLRENTTIPAVLFENLFLSNPKEAGLLKNADFVDGLAEAYVLGIAKAFNLSLKVIEKPKEPYADIKGHWAEDYIRQVMSEGLLVGFPDGTFKPDEPATRAQIATLAVKLREDIIEKVVAAVRAAKIGG